MNKDKKQEHDHSGQASNQKGCFVTFIGCAIKGFYSQPRKGSASVLVFNCDWGLAINSNGSYWIVTPDEVENELQQQRKRLEESVNELKDIVVLSGSI